MIVMAIDLGDRRTGICFSDATGLIAGRSFVIDEYSRDKLVARLCNEIEKQKPRRIVLGLPVNMDGSEGERAQLSRDFAARLTAACGLDVVLWDERTTSVSANRMLSDAGKKRGKQRARVDAVAAAIILQNYLDFLKIYGGPSPP